MLVDTANADLGAKQTYRPSGAVQRQVLDKLSDQISAKDFGADPSLADNAPQLNLFGHALNATGKLGRIPAGVYNFRSQLLPLGSTPTGNAGWTGDGKSMTILNYTGSDPTIDLVLIPCAINAQCPKTAFDDMSIRSTTKMTAGAALHAVWTTFSNWKNLEAGTINLGSTLYHGFWFDQGHFMTLQGIDSQTSADCLRINDAISIDLESYRALGTSCDIGIHAGGGVGGLLLGYIDQYGARIGLLIDTSISPNPNAQFFVGPRAQFDTNRSACVYLSDALATSGKTFNFDGWCANTQNSPATAGSGAFDIIQWNGGTVTLGGGSAITFNNGSGIVYSDPSVLLLIDQAAGIVANGKSGNGGYAVNCGGSGANIRSSFVGNGSNPSGDYSPQCSTGQIPGASWPTYAPTITCATATFTNIVGAYRVIGKMTDVSLDFSLSAAGNCLPGTAFTITLPVVLASSAAATARENTAGTKTLICSGSAGASSLACTSSASLAAGDRYQMSLRFQNQ